MANVEVWSMEATNGDNLLFRDGTAAHAVKAAYDETTALYAHTVGNIVYVNGYLYEVTAAIAVGDSIAVGTNVKAAGIAAGTTIYVENIADGTDGHNGVYVANADGTAVEYASVVDTFASLYGLCTKTTTIETVSGNKQITETGDGVTAVTTIVKTSSTVTTITAVITPSDGDYYYTKTTTITATAGGKTISESYTQTAKA